MENMFDEILEKNEQIVQIIKPNKGRYLKECYKPFMLPFFWPHFIIIMVCTLFTLPYFFVKGYNNTFYAYTNKRLIVRKGFFGNSYDSLEYKDISSTSIKVGFLDKNSSTGTLIFASPSSQNEHPMKFANIENPYQVMNEIKEYIEITNK